MNFYREQLVSTRDIDDQLRSQLTLRLSLVAILFVTPFATHNFFRGRYLLGMGAFVIIGFLAYNAWSISRGRHSPRLNSLGLTPAILGFLAFSMHTQGLIGYLWCYPSVITLYFLLPERQAWIANGILVAIALPNAWQIFSPPVAIRAGTTFLAVSLFTITFVRVIMNQQHELQQLAVTDTLTGLYDRTLLQRTLERAIHQHSRTGVPMTLLSIDLDYFKAINDSFGHDAGDRVLQGIGTLMKNRARRTDRVFRLGGEEFLVMLYGTDQDNGLRVAEELRSAVASSPLLPERPVTASIGVATLQSDEDWLKWMKRSDESLYRAKQSGRNQVMVSQ